MFTTRSALAACLSMSQHSLMNSLCVLACCCSGLWSSFKHLAGFLWLRRMPRKSCFTQLKRFKNIFFLKKKNDPDSDVFVFLGNKPVSRRSTSLTLQGDFCVLMIGRAALRCKKRGVKRRAARAAQKKTCAAQRHTKWTSEEGAHFNSEYLGRIETHFNSGYGTAKSGIRLSRTHRTYARKRTKTDRVTAPRYPNRNNTDNREYRSKQTQENAQHLWLVSCKDCVQHADLQQPKRSSLGAAAAVPPGGTEPSPAENAYTIMSCKLLCTIGPRTCSNDDHAAPSPRSSPARKSSASPAHDLGY